MSFLQNIYGILLRPETTLKELNLNYNLTIFWQALALFAICLIVVKGFVGSEIIGFSLNWLAANTMIFLAAYIFILKGKEYWRFIALLAFANLPMIFLAPISIIDHKNFLLASMLKFGINLWIFVLSLTAVSCICAIPKRRVILLYS